MKLYKLIRIGGWGGYDTYDSFVVCAKSKKDARKIVPFNDAWVYSEDDIKVEYLGRASGSLKRGEILGSFNAG